MTSVNKYNYNLWSAVTVTNLGVVSTFTLFKKQGLRTRVSMIACLTLSFIPLVYKKTLAFFKEPPHLNDFDSYRQFHDFILKHERFKEIPLHLNYADYQNNRFEVSKNQWSSDWNNRQFVLPATRTIVENIFHDYVYNASSILEVGSNKLLRQGGSADKYSYLATLLPKEHLENLTYSDYIKSIVDRANHPKYLHLDLRKDTLANDQKHVIVAINVADVMKREDLGLFAKGVYHSLKNKGTVIFLADRSIEYTPLLAKFSDQNFFAFPSCKNENCNDQGVKVIHKNILRKAINTLDFDHKDMLTEIVDLLPIQQHFYLTRAMCNQEGMQIFHFLNELTKNLPYEYYDRIETYEKDVIDAFESNGFKKKYSGFKENSIVIPTNTQVDSYYEEVDEQTKEEINKGIPSHFSYNQRTNVYEYDLRNRGFKIYNIYEIPIGSIQITACFHTIIFEKNEGY